MLFLAKLIKEGNCFNIFKEPLKRAPFLTLIFHALFRKQAKQSYLQEEKIDGAFLLLDAFSESAFFESAFLESAFSETYRKK